MAHFRLRTQLFIATVLIIFGLTGALLLIIHHTVRVEIQKQVREGTEVSVRAFESVQRQRELQLSRTAAMLADIPTLKALMTTEHNLTIQDGSATFWKLAGSDLFVLAKPDKEVVALHMTKPGWSAAAAARHLRDSIDQSEDASWWYDDGRLYWVFIRPIIAGSGNTAQPLGLLAVGYQVDSTVAQQLAVMAGNQIALTTDEKVIASTLPSHDESELERKIQSGNISSSPSPSEISLETDDYAFSSVSLKGGSPSLVRCYVLVPLVPVNNFMRRLNHTIYIVGALAVLFSAVLFGFVANRITHPLDDLVSGVQALAAGDFTYSITPRGSSEVVKLSTAFAQMRGQLLTSQQQRIETERVAALARAASSLSHDLRHYLATVVANAEFLYEADELKMNKKEIYEEIKAASNQMTDLIDSLRELSYQRSTISPVPASLSQVIRHAVEAIHAKPEFRNARIAFSAPDDLEGSFDPRKLERAFFNLLLNACEATEDQDRIVTVDARTTDSTFEIRVIDNGSGVHESIRNTLFDPFVSLGKPNGTGLGLAIVSKIVSDHTGSISIESTSKAGTVVLVQLPKLQPSVPTDVQPTIS